MKCTFSLKNIALIALFLIISPLLINAQDYYYQDHIISQNYVPRQEYDAFDQFGLPKVRSKEVVFIYLDFPDGRLNGNIPQSNADLLAIVNNGGCLDAVGEIGLTNTTSPFPTSGNPNLFANLFKYKWSDRWNMLFSTGGVYQGSAHPDYYSHIGYTNLSKEAYGSFRDYWKEVSNLHYEVLPALTHSNETETMYRTGIANNIRNFNGERVIESIMLPLKKYDINSYNGYFPDFNNLHTGGMNKMLSDAHTIVENMHSNNTLEFDINNFDGIVIFVIAGSHSKFKGIGMGSETIVRGMYDQISSDYAVIDGITCLTHEFAHLALGWQHTVAGRNCLMNPNQTKDINCPSHPNPILKLREGWVTPIHLSSNLNNIELQPVETSMQVGIITIYGNPSAAPDHLSGECYVVENRRQIGFDKRLTRDGEFPNFKGGLLIWHYGPYGEFNFPSGLDLEVNAYKLITPNDVDPYDIFQSQGNQEYYFAYNDGLPNQNFYNLIQSRTFSQENLKTGIQYAGIHQSNYGDINSSVLFNLSYNISLPPQYDYTVINYTSQSNNLVSSSGRIYFHKANSYDYFRLYPGAKLDIAPNTAFSAEGIKAIGDESNKIIFTSPGYENINESYYCKFNGMGSPKLKTYSDVDGVYFKNLHYINVNNNKTKIGMLYNVNSILTPVEIENITTNNPCTDKSSYDISIVGALINKLYVDGLSTRFVQIQTTAQCYINLLNTYSGFYATNTFSNNANVVFSNCNLVNGSSTILKPVDGSFWQGLKVYGGGINFNTAQIKGATTGITLNNLIDELKITNCTFDNLNQDLAIDSYFYDKTPGNGQIYGNHFTPTGVNTPVHIWVSNTKYILIDNNDLLSVKTTGISLFNCNMPNVINNRIQGSGSDQLGIVSYSSSGSYQCNTISNCYEGIELDNSQPLLYQNNVHTNGIGMYVTNSSYPIMSPAYSGNETNNLAGYNHFYNNSGQEIYIRNTVNATSNLLMNDGYNMIEDDGNNDFLIYIENEGLTPSEVIYCANNYWGNVSDPGSKLFPSEYFNYNPFLISLPAPPTNCQITTVSENNSSKSQQTLLLGDALKSNMNNDFVSAANYSQQLTNLSGSLAYHKTGSRLYFSNKYSEGTGISNLPSYYDNLIIINGNDTLLQKFFKGLKIESQVINDALQNALSELDGIISNATNSYELLYANIDKLRILSILDSSSGGDNQNSNISFPEVYNLLKSDLSKTFGNSKSITNNKQYQSKLKSSNSKFDYLLKRIPNNIEDLSNKSHSQISEIMRDKILYEILNNNFVSNVPPIRSDEYKSKKMSGLNNNLPTKFELSQNYPNPFNPYTTIKYSLPKDGFVSLKIYDITGREVITLVNEIRKTGFYSITFNASELSSGIYFYKLEARNFIQTKRMVLIK